MNSAKSSSIDFFLSLSRIYFSAQHSFSVRSILRSFVRSVSVIMGFWGNSVEKERGARPTLPSYPIRSFSTQKEPRKDHSKRNRPEKMNSGRRSNRDFGNPREGRGAKVASGFSQSVSE